MLWDRYRPPGWSFASKTKHLRPSRLAADSPVKPAPITTTGADEGLAISGLSLFHQAVKLVEILVRIDDVGPFQEGH